MVRIHDQFAPSDFMVLDMGEEEDDTPIYKVEMATRGGGE